MGERQEKRIQIKEKPIKAHKKLTANEIRQLMYSNFEIYGFFISEGRFLFAFFTYIDHAGNQVITCRLFMSTIEFLPYEKRVELYKEMAPYLKKKFVKNPHLMPTTADEIKKYMVWRVSSVEIL
jgi:hypothetical protein